MAHNTVHKTEIKCLKKAKPWVRVYLVLSTHSSDIYQGLLCASTVLATGIKAGTRQHALSPHSSAGTDTISKQMLLKMTGGTA